MFGLRCPHCRAKFIGAKARWSEPARQRRAVVACDNPLCGASFLLEISPYEDREFTPIRSPDLFNYTIVYAAERIPSYCCKGAEQRVRTSRHLNASAREVRTECRACGKATRMLASLIAEVSPSWLAGKMRLPAVPPPPHDNATDLQQSAAKNRRWITRQARRLAGL